jgi:hypothetical protein
LLTCLSGRRCLHVGHSGLGLSRSTSTSTSSSSGDSRSHLARRPWPTKREKNVNTEPANSARAVPPGKAPTPGYTPGIGPAGPLTGLAPVLGTGHGHVLERYTRGSNWWCILLPRRGAARRAQPLLGRASFSFLLFVLVGLDLDLGGRL